VVLRAIDKFHVGASCRVTIDKFPLRHGRLGAVRVAWGKGEMLGKKTMVVVTDAPDGGRLSVVPDAGEVGKAAKGRRRGTRKGRKKGRGKPS
jgi:hypothetical protein